MTRLAIYHYGELKTTEHETPYAAMNALVRSAEAWDYFVIHWDAIENTMSGDLVTRHNNEHRGSWTIGELTEEP